MALRGRVGALATRVFPNLDERSFNRARNAHVAPLIAAGAYDSRLADLSQPGRSLIGKESHIVIVPMEGPSHATWKAAGGNFFYEIAQSAREYAGAHRVTVFEVVPGENPTDWHERLIRFLISSGATHLMAQIESDPNPPADGTWDVLWPELALRWQGVFLGVMFDSGFRIITLSARRLAKTCDRFVVVDICVPMDNVMVKGRPEVGPVSMPISNETFALLDSEFGSLEQIYDVSFIGALYPYRVEMIEALRSSGVTVAVNPHRVDATSDFESSRSNQPSYVDYMRGLAQSKITINFAMASSLAGYQLKTRILEGTGVGTLVLTDDVDRSSRFWGPGEGIDYFSDPSEVPEIVARYLNAPSVLESVQNAGKARARHINVSCFWGGIDEGLARRHLPTVRTTAPTKSL